MSDPTIWTGVDRYEFLVDAERGVILGVTAFHKGKAFAGEAFLDVEFTGRRPQCIAWWDQIGHVAGLLYNAQASFSAVHGSWRWWNQAEEKKKWNGLPLKFGKARRSQATEYVSRFWVEMPSRFRGEFSTTDGSEESIFVMNGSLWWDSISEGSVMTNEARELVHSSKVSVLQETVGHQYQDAEDAIIAQMPLNPSWLLSGMRIESVGRTTYLARDAIVVEGRPIEGATDRYWWTGADEYRLVIDAKHGFLLRIGAFHDGGEFAGAEVTTLKVDQPIDKEVFTFPIFDDTHVRVVPRRDFQKVKPHSIS